MGIKDLLRFMKPYIEPIHIKKYAGKRVGIDAYSWLHKGAYSCSMELCLNSEGDTKLRYLKYFMHRINLLRHHDVTPVVVFDGGSIPCKAFTEQERHSKRKANRDLAMRKLKEGDVTAASEFFQRAVSITPSMAYQLIQILRLENIEFVVAPYEADAQLAYLSSLDAEQGGIVAVITEDSDLIAYGCPATVFKMDKFGNGEEIVLDRVFKSTVHGPSFQKFDKDLFTGMCVLAGCDFLPSVPGIGIFRAHSLVTKYRNIDRVLSTLKFDKGDQVPEGYVKSFQEAVAVFQHAQIYDAGLKRLKHMKPIPQKLQESLDGGLDFLGPDIPPSVAVAIAQGNLDPTTMEAFDRSLNSKSDCTSVVTRTYGQPQQSVKPVMPTKETCFTVFTNKAVAKTITVKCTEEVQKPDAEDRKYTREAVKMSKMIPSSEARRTSAKKIVPQDTQLKVPDNNPFKRKHGKVLLDRVESYSDQVSEVIDLDIPNNFGVSAELQESVNSKPKASNRKENRKSAKKSKSSFEKSESKKSGTILNFFSKV